MFYLYYGGASNYTAIYSSSANVWEEKSTVFTCVSNQYNIIRLHVASSSSTHYYKNVFLVDLTELYGSGNEPTATEFRKKYSRDWYDYCPGLVNQETTEILLNRNWNLIFNKSNFSSTFTSSGITCTNNGNGSVTVNGTATAAVYFTLGLAGSYLTSGHQYILFGIPAGSSGVELYMYCNGTYIGEYGYGNVFTASGGAYVGASNIVIASGKTVNNVKVIPLLCDLTAMFGSGQEPNANEFLNMVSRNKAYAYKSVGFGDLKWTNASTTTSFAAQTLSLDLSDYSTVLILVRGGTDGTVYNLNIARTDQKCNLLSWYGNLIVSREATISSTGITFLSGLYWGDYKTKTASETNAIPCKIWGIK